MGIRKRVLSARQKLNQTGALVMGFSLMEEGLMVSGMNSPFCPGTARKKPGPPLPHSDPQNPLSLEHLTGI
ncbi:MAG: hypothetical protein K9L23_03020 [Desulfotignum sp.]|nr:hypothetical protein [Desulfotignum sp.]MCF8087020.1 hypothetical protein [Desulfotignum sp.]